MAKIYITGEDHPEEVGHVEAEEILTMKNDPTYKGLIPVNNRNVPKARIKDITFSSMGTSLKSLDITTESGRMEVRNFEKIIDGYCKAMEDLVKENVEENDDVEFDVTHFGESLENSKIECLRKKPFHVYNNLFGIVHFGVVRYAEKEGAVVRHKGWYGWAIANHSTEGKIDISAFVDFKAKWDALTELKSRRAYAQQKELEQQEESLLGGRKKVINKLHVDSDQLSTES